MLGWEEVRWAKDGHLGIGPPCACYRLRDIQDAEAPCRGCRGRPMLLQATVCLSYLSEAKGPSGCQQLNMTENENAGRCLGSPVSALSQPPAVAVATRDQAAYLGTADGLFRIHTSTR